MSTVSTSPRATEDSVTPRRHSLTEGQKPGWTWMAVAAAAAVVAAGLTVLLSGAFNVVGFVIIAAILYIAGLYVATRVMENRRRAADGLCRNLVWLAFLVALVPLVSVLWSVLSAGLPTLIANPQIMAYDMKGITGIDDSAWVEAGKPAGELAGGFGHALIGTVVITIIATLISVPIGMLTSIYLVEYSRGGWFSRAIVFFVDVMTGIPSIVAGLFAYAAITWVLTLVTGSNSTALQSVQMGLTAAIALSVLMIPVVVRSTEEMLRVVPNELREGAYALGVRKWQTIAKVVLPTAISGIASGVTLAIARVAGETAPILVTAGFATSINWNPFDNWMTALPVYIYRQLVAPTSPTAADPSTARAWAAALLLVTIVMLLNLAARFIAKAFAPKKGR
ncbi:phosphate ABC transporter permease PstA [Micrococcus luteus]|uniref:phosphate ABC transporter permease PstA n=1 Tax=Micrococcus luteus TaxID=1270 RepID=UPI00288CD781|nr:phosphate ABC transporter permease PstA [Micrococcus luteus]MDT1991729.1 phosphate ABC transporter permease PstA [Micrococcus luteus]